jgi:hypothetical protein
MDRSKEVEIPDFASDEIRAEDPYSLQQKTFPNIFGSGSEG